MSEISIKEPMVLALYFNSRGFGYALFEGIMDPVDWGIKTRSGAAVATTVEQVRLLLHLFQPSVVVLQQCNASLMHCSERVKEQIAQVVALAGSKRIKVRQYSRVDIRACFLYDGARTKDEIARAIAKRLPEFQSRVPPMRKPWMREDYHMGLFDAIALVFTYYSKEHVGRS